MNRRDRRAQGKSATTKPGTPSDVQGLFEAGLFHHRAGRLPEAEQIYRQVLAASPRHADAQHLLGVIARQFGQSDLAVDLIGKAIRINPDVAFYHSNLANALRDLGRFRDAVAAYRTAIGLAPDVADTHNSLGNALKDLGRNADAVAAYDAAIRLKPDFAEAHNNRGNALKDAGRLGDAVAAYEAAIRLKPDLAQIHYNLGVALRDMGRFEDAVAAYGSAIRLKPDYAEAHNNLGNALKDMGRLEDAVGAFRTALRHNPALAEPHNNLGGALKDLGRPEEAVAAYNAAIRAKPDYAEACANLGVALCEIDNPQDGLVACVRSLELKETAQGKAGFVECLSRLRLVPDAYLALTQRALDENWSDPGKLAPVVVSTLKARLSLTGDAALVPSIDRLAGENLLLSLMRQAPINDAPLERTLTACRATLLRDLTDEPATARTSAAMLRFMCALAAQCFVNEFVFDCGDDELAAVDRIGRSVEAALAADAPIDETRLIVLGCYAPLHSLVGAQRLLTREWSAPVAEALALQIAEPLEERKIRTEIAALTPIETSVSTAVRQQYEENPYPRWTRVEPMAPCASIEIHIRNQIPRAPLVSIGNPSPEILVAGCGTGRHPIETALIFTSAKVLAIDLSLASLGYAVRKAKALALPNLDFAQADILRLGATGRRFDAIESVGVLHHLAEPQAGLEVLVSLLKDNGFLRLGLYSGRARRSVVAVREFIAEKGYGADAAGIRNCRRDLLALDEGDPRRKVADWSDFASASGCRDLLFHVQEHRCTLPQIADWLDRYSLRFLGFDIASATGRAFRLAYPQPDAEIDLGLWDAFEERNPDTFGGMYQFWVQKIA